MEQFNLIKVKDVVTLVAAVCGIITGLWGAFKPEKKAQSSYQITSDRIAKLESHIIELYDVVGDQQKEITSLLTQISNAQNEEIVKTYSKLEIKSAMVNPVPTSAPDPVKVKVTPIPTAKALTLSPQKQNFPKFEDL